MTDSAGGLASISSDNVADSDPIDLSRYTSENIEKSDSPTICQNLSLISFTSPEKNPGSHRVCEISPKKQSFRESRIARLCNNRKLRLTKPNPVVATNLAQNSPEHFEFGLENVKPIRRCLFPPSPKNLPKTEKLPISVGTQTDLTIIRKLPKKKTKRTPWMEHEDEFLILGLKRHPKGMSQRWINIKRDYFNDSARNHINIKDRYRQLLKDEKIEPNT